MKQRITVDQLQELTEEQKQRLRGWWKPEEGDLVYNKFFNEFKQEELPLLDIGQMIELLLNRAVDPIEEPYELFINENLCNELWSAVKQVL